jgi:opacity protein-like surface antigen
MSTASSSSRAKFQGSLVLGLVCLAAAAGARAQSEESEEPSDEGFYVGVGFGPSTFDQSKQEFDAGLFGSFTSAGFTVTNPTSQLDNSSTELHGLIGYRLNPYFGFELSFMDVGKLSYSANMTLSGGGLTSPAPGSIAGELSAKGPVLSILGSLPLRKRWEVYGRLGLFFAETTLDLSAAVGNVSSSAGISARSTDTVLGIGGAFNATRRFSVRLEYQKLKNVGDPDQTGEGDIDVIDLGVVIRL